MITSAQNQTLKLVRKLHSRRWRDKLGLFVAEGDANAAQAIQRVSGVTIQDNKYVFVRGLGERYSATMLNSTRIATSMTVEMNRPTANSSESPGRIGNSSPHSMKTITMLIQNSAFPNWSSNQFGSIQSIPNSSGLITRPSVSVPS